jgi:hypothetical protein
LVDADHAWNHPKPAQTWVVFDLDPVINSVVWRVCVDLLRAAFGTTPEPATVALFDQVRLDPGSV